MKMIESIKRIWNIPLIEYNTKNGEKSINSRKTKQTDTENYSRLKNGNISNKENTNRGSPENGWMQTWSTECYRLKRESKVLKTW